MGSHILKKNKTVLCDMASAVKHQFSDHKSKFMHRNKKK